MKMTFCMRYSFAIICILLFPLCITGLIERARADGPDYLDQGWSAELRQAFYYTPQGSLLIPYKWFMALEVPQTGDLFSDTSNLERYGLLPADGTHSLNPGNLPVGFAIHRTASAPQQGNIAQRAEETAQRSSGAGATSGMAYLGLTCAACHTADVTVRGRKIRIDGAPARFDFDVFYADLVEAVVATVADEQRFARFAQRVLTEPGLTGASELKLAFAAFKSRMAGEGVMRRPAVASGFGRVDALTQIVNSISARDQKEPHNLRPVGAPTSYPALWLTPRLEFVQWNPIAASPIARNGGQVLGVFGRTTLTGSPGSWYSSSMLLQQLHELETWIQQLRAPKWDTSVMGPIDKDLAKQGETLFAEHCAGCHNMKTLTTPYRETDPADNFFNKTFIKIGRVNYLKVGTDPTYVTSLLQRLAITNPATARLLDNKPVAPAAAYFLRTVGASVARAMTDAGIDEQKQLDMHGYRFRRSVDGSPIPYLPPSFTDLKASPLEGVWATGPYLHNGSVPTIYELLSPESERRQVFWTGGQELDLKRLGYVSDDAPGRFRFDTTLPGNRNTGHIYPAGGLSEDERLAVIQYLKTL